VDAWDPSPTASKLVNKYYVMFVNDFSHFSWLYACIARSQISLIFSGFKTKVENLLATSIKIIQL
jgi:hypothetical protein